MGKARVIFIAVMILAASRGLAQTNEQLYGKKKFDNQEMSAFKATTTVFFIKKDSAEATRRLKEAISSAWTITPIIFDEISHYEKYAGDARYSYFTVESKYDRNSGGSGTECYMVLRMFDNVSKKGKVQTKALAMFYLQPNDATHGIIQLNPNEVLPSLYNRGWFYNWDPVVLKAHLQVIQTNLNNGMRVHEMDEFKLKELAQLQSDTLYVPKHFLMTYPYIIGQLKQKFENVFNVYKYPYRICTPDELYQVFEVEKRGRFLFEYVNISSLKTFSIFDTKDKKLLYRKIIAISMTLKEKDIERLNDAID